MCRKATKQLEDIRDRMNREEEQRLERQKRAPAMERESDCANDPNGAYWAHYKDIMARPNSENIDYSSIDGKIGIRMRVTGYSASQIYEAIENNGPAMRKETMGAAEWDAKYRNRDWNRFAKETVEKYVFGSRGAAQYTQAESYRPYYLKVEGRTSRQEQTETRDLGR
jgi:hypothetical protein